MKARASDFVLILKSLFLILVIGIFVNQKVFANNSRQIIHDNEKAKTQKPLQRQDLIGVEAFVDYLVKKGIEQHNLPGVTVSIVKEGKIVLLKGYGFADLNSQVKVSPNETMFRIGSITKTMTAIAVMQLVEQGKLAIDADISEYLSGFEIPKIFNEPITIRSLLSHRAGFEEDDAGNLFVENPSKVFSAEEYLATHIPKRIWSPGLNVSYSNYGFGLLGYLVELKSGMDLATYIEQNIFSTLGMQNTILREPIENNKAFIPMKAALKQQLATGYFRDGKGNNVEKPFEFIGHIAGAGAVSSTAHDMALYMISLMSDNSRLVNPLTSKEMKQRLYNDRPLATGIAYGMFDGKFKGYKQFYHEGGTPTFLSNMVIFPEIHLGIFVSTNVVGSGSHLVETLPNSILNKYYRTKPTKPNINSKLFAEQIGQRSLEDYTGTWLSTRRSYSQLEKLSALNKSVSISNDKQGGIVMTNSGNKLKLKRLKANVFQGESGDAPVFYFYQDDLGNIDRFSASMWSGDFERVSFLQSPFFFYLALALSSLFSLSTLLLSFIRNRKSKRLSVFEKLACYSAGMVLTVVLGFTFMNSGLVFDDYDFNLNFPRIDVKLLLCLVIAIVLTTLAKVAGHPFIWRLSDLRLYYKIHYLVFTISCLNFLYVFWLWNAIGFNYFG